MNFEALKVLCGLNIHVGINTDLEDPQTCPLVLRQEGFSASFVLPPTQQTHPAAWALEHLGRNLLIFLKRPNSGSLQMQDASVSEAGGEEKSKVIPEA